MDSSPFSIDRRKFIRSGATLAAAVATTGLMGLGHQAMANDQQTMTRDHQALAREHLADDGLYMIGPREGYTPYIGSLVSMMNYNRHTILNLTKGMTMEQLDHLQDPQSNTIGALLMHLAVVDKWYYNNSFKNLDDFTEEEKKLWGPALDLGDKGRQSIKGHELSYYVDLLTSTRADTLQAFKSKDDKWLLAVDPAFSKDEKFNNYWKWFHVCEHESHHRGQIAWLKKRIPGIKDTND